MSDADHLLSRIKSLKDTIESLTQESAGVACQETNMKNRIVSLERELADERLARERAENDWDVKLDNAESSLILRLKQYARRRKAAYKLVDKTYRRNWERQIIGLEGACRSWERTFADISNKHNIKVGKIQTELDDLKTAIKDCACLCNDGLCDKCATVRGEEL